MACLNVFTYFLYSVRTSSLRVLQRECNRTNLASVSIRYSSTQNQQDWPKDYAQEFRRSVEDPAGFWEEKAEQVKWFKKWDQVLDHSHPPFTKWFKGGWYNQIKSRGYLINNLVSGKVNTCYNAVDYHVENGRKDQVALIYDSPVTNTVKKYTYGQLREEVARVAGALHSLGVSKGDRVLIYMPMVPEGNRLLTLFNCFYILYFIFHLLFFMFFIFIHLLLLFYFILLSFIFIIYFVYC